MKLVSGHTYLRGENGEVVPFSESLAKASKYTQFVQEGDVENELQLPENQKIVARKAIPKPVVQEVVKKEPVNIPSRPKMQPMQPEQAKKLQPPVKPQKLPPMDIRAEMASDLSALEG